VLQIDALKAGGQTLVRRHDRDARPRLGDLPQLRGRRNQAFQKDEDIVRGRDETSQVVSAGDDPEAQARPFREPLQAHQLAREAVGEAVDLLASE
jgi:hypothetical protein